MRRRLLLVLLALLAAAGAVRLRARRHAARRIAASEAAAAAVGVPHRALPAPSARLTAGVPLASDDDVAIGERNDDRGTSTHPQVEPESAAVMEPREPNPSDSIRRAPAASRFLSIPWSPHPDPPPADATELRLHCTLTADGMELARVDVRETASQVFVTVLARWAPAAPRTSPDTAAGRKRETTATLREPLGERALVHAPHDDPPVAKAPHEAAPLDDPPR